MNTATAVAPAKLDVETQKFFDQWGNFIVSGCNGSIFSLKKVIKEITPDSDGTLRIVWKKGNKVHKVRIRNKRAERLIEGNFWSSFFSIIQHVEQ